MAVERKVESTVKGLAAPVTLTSLGHEPSAEDNHIEYDENMTKRLLRKIDRHVLPPLVILYLMSFLDRTNIGNARLAHLEDDLHLKGLDYNVFQCPRRCRDNGSPSCLTL